MFRRRGAARLRNFLIGPMSKLRYSQKYESGSASRIGACERQCRNTPDAGYKNKGKKWRKTS
ncbi:MAG TPA: hypothetical protein VJ572_02315 [Azonexus sp.]|nr:hypothetical protein [Azonexus sp.]